MNNIAEFISSIIPPLQNHENVKVALTRMNEFKVNNLPVVIDKKYLGIISEEMLIDVVDHQILISDLNLKLLNVSVYSDNHFYDVIRLFNNFHLSIVPVIDKHKKYLGSILFDNVLSYVARQFAVNEQGAIIVLTINNRDNYLSQIAQIVEVENAQILSSTAVALKNSEHLEMTLKINKSDVTAIVASFERYGYNVKMVYYNNGQDDGYLDRYNSLMNYLNI